MNNIPHEQGFLLQIARASYINQFWFQLLINSSTSSFKKLNSLNFPIFICQYSIGTKFPFNILKFYFQTTHFLLPFS